MQNLELDRSGLKIDLVLPVVWFGHITSLLEYQFGFLDSKTRIMMSFTMPSMVPDTSWKLNKRLIFGSWTESDMGFFWKPHTTPSTWHMDCSLKGRLS